MMEITNEGLLQILSYHILVSSYRNLYKKWTNDSEEAIENEETLGFDKTVG